MADERLAVSTRRHDVNFSQLHMITSTKTVVWALPKYKCHDFAPLVHRVDIAVA